MNMKDKITEAINHVRNKRKNLQSYHKNKKHQLIKGSLGKLSNLSKTMNGVTFNKPKGKGGSYFVTNKNNNSCIISNKSPKKVKTVTSPKLISPSTPDEISIFDNTMLTSKKQQPSTTSISVTPKTPTSKAKEVFRKYCSNKSFFFGKNETTNNELLKHYYSKYSKIPGRFNK